MATSWHACRQDSSSACRQCRSAAQAREGPWHLHFADELALLPVHERQVAPAAAQQQVRAAAGEGQVVGPELRQVQVKHLPGCPDVCLLHNVFLRGTRKGSSGMRLNSLWGRGRYLWSHAPEDSLWVLSSQPLLHCPPHGMEARLMHALCRHAVTYPPLLESARRSRVASSLSGDIAGGWPHL